MINPAPLTSLSSSFEQEGYSLERNVIPSKQCLVLLETIHQNISKAAQEIDVKPNEYLRSVSRWAAPSPVLQNILEPIIEPLTQQVTELLNTPVQLKKWNLICKNAHCFHAIPFHQDISYSPDDPYQVTAWLSLNTVDNTSGPLQVIPKSHLLALHPAVDFWSPDFKESGEENSIKLPTNQGDIIYFDSRLWHGSGPSISQQDRYALVTRWSSLHNQPLQEIPPIQPSPFGMWSCGKVTHEILAKSAKLFLDIDSNNFTDLLDIWILALQSKTVELSINHKNAIENLKRIKILHLAHEKHNGGDATGLLYKQLWQDFLSPLQIKLKETTNA